MCFNSMYSMLSESRRGKAPSDNDIKCSESVTISVNVNDTTEDITGSGEFEYAYFQRIYNGGAASAQERGEEESARQ